MYTCTLIAMCKDIMLQLSLNSMDICASDPRPPTSQLTTNWSVCIYIQLFLNPFSWGQGVDSVSYPGPSIHPIMSLKMYILLYIYVTYYGMNWIHIFVLSLSQNRINFVWVWYIYSFWTNQRRAKEISLEILKNDIKRNCHFYLKTNGKKICCNLVNDH